MKNKITTIIALTLLTSAFNIANAAYVLRVPTEASNGGFLENGSISFVSNAGIPAEVPTEPLNPMQVCDSKKGAVQQLLAKDYTGTTIYYAGIGSYMGVEGCVIDVAIPTSKSYECTGNNNYEDQMSNALKAIDYTVTSFDHQGTCS